MTKRRTIDLGAVGTARTNLGRIAKEHPDLVGQPSKTNREAWEATLEKIMTDGSNAAGEGVRCIRFAVEGTTRLRGLHVVFARQLEPGSFQLHPGLKLGGLTVRSFQIPRAHAPDGTPRLDLFAFVVIGHGDLELDDVVMLEGAGDLIGPKAAP
jgi:hypothetical protein